MIKAISRLFKSQDSNHEYIPTTDVIAMAKVISELKQQNDELKKRADRYWKLYEDLRTGEPGSNSSCISSLEIARYFQEHMLAYEIKADGDYVRIISKEDASTISFNREFDKTKSNHNWVTEGSALITIKLDNVPFMVKGPCTTIKSPCSGIFECDSNKLIGCNEEICRIRKYEPDEKQKILEAIEREEIKKSVLSKERKKMIEKETLEELIAEGKVFNVFTLKSGRRMTIPYDLASAVWNRDGGQCCVCGSKTDLEFDHIIPISKGGATTFRNLQILCKKCNLKKSDSI